MSDNTLYPNTFQHHNAYVDQIHFFLTGNEVKVLDRIIREIMGWEEKRKTLVACISISTLVEGKFSKEDGRRLCQGCGLSDGTVRKILKTLCRFGLIERVGDPTRDGQSYKLQLDWDTINWDAMRERRAKKDERYRQQMRKARESNPLLSNSTPSVEQEGGASVEQEGTPPVEQETKNPSLNPSSNPDITPHQEMFGSLANLCQIDLELITADDRGKLNTVSKRLLDNGKTPKHLSTFREYWYSQDWRGQRGQPPGPWDVIKEWGRAKTWVQTGKNGGTHANTSRNRGRSAGARGAAQEQRPRIASGQAEAIQAAIDSGRMGSYADGWDE